MKIKPATKKTMSFAVVLLFFSFMAAAQDIPAPDAATDPTPTETALELPSHNALRQALRSAVETGNGGFDFNVWATMVDRDGNVRMVVYTGEARDQQWPGSRVVSAQKAYTANAFSHPEMAFSTANLYSTVQPGGSNYGLEQSNPVDATVAYGGDAGNIGTENDPMVGEKVGGLIMIGGGLPFYNSEGHLIGALGVSGDTSCADHNIAWKVRHELGFDYVPSGVSRTGDDNIAYGDADWSHPECSPESSRISNELPNSHPVRRTQ